MFYSFAKQIVSRDNMERIESTQGYNVSNDKFFIKQDIKPSQRKENAENCGGGVKA